MGGTVIETESEKIIKRSKAQVIVQMCQADGFDDEAILERIQNIVGVSLAKAKAYLDQYGKQLV